MKPVCHYVFFSNVFFFSSFSYLFILNGEHSAVNVLFALVYNYLGIFTCWVKHTCAKKTREKQH